MRTGKPELLSEINKKLIVDLLRKEGSKSRAEIRRTLGMSFPTVSTNVNALLQSGLIQEIGVSDSSVGRKATMLQYNNKKGYVLGIDIGRSHIRTMITDISGNIIASSASKEITPKTGDEIIQQLDIEIDMVLKEADIDKNCMMGIGVGIPGIVDEQLGKNRLVPFIEAWQDVRVDLHLKERFNIPVFIGNSVNYGAIGEKWKGAGRGFSNIIYINYGIGIGSALILNGDLFIGANGAAGEIGYILPDYAKSHKVFTEEGVLEQLISGSELDKIIKEDKEYKDISIQDLFKQRDESQELLKQRDESQELVEHRDEPNEKIMNLISEIKKNIAITLINLVSVINPEIIIIGGGIGNQIVQLYHEELNNILAAHVPYVPKLLASQLGDKANVLGAIGIVLRSIHDDYNYLDKY